MGQSIQEWISKFCGRQPLKNFKGYGLLEQLIFTCSKSAIDTSEKDVKYVKSYQYNNVSDVVLMFLFIIFIMLFLALNIKNYGKHETKQANKKQ